MTHLGASHTRPSFPRERLQGDVPTGWCWSQCLQWGTPRPPASWGSEILLVDQAVGDGEAAATLGCPAKPAFRGLVGGRREAPSDPHPLRQTMRYPPGRGLTPFPGVHQAVPHCMN